MHKQLLVKSIRLQLLSPVFAFSAKNIHTCIHTLYLATVKISVTKLLFKNKTDLHVCRVGVRGGQLAIYFISKICIGSNGSDVRWKAKGLK